MILPILKNEAIFTRLKMFIISNIKVILYNKQIDM